MTVSVWDLHEHGPVPYHSFYCETCIHIMNDPVYVAEAQADSLLFRTDVCAWFRLHNPVSSQAMTDEEIKAYLAPFPK